jgi:hypothetical protein
MLSSLSQPPWDFSLRQKGLFRHYPFSHIAPIVVASAGAVRSNTPPILTLSTGGNAATFNQMEAGENSNTGDWSNLTDGKIFWGRPKHYSCFIRPRIFNGPVTRSAQCGIGIGQALTPQTIVSLMAFSTAWDSPIIRLWARMDAPAWECAVWDGTGLPAHIPAPNTLVGVPVPTLGKIYRAEIFYKPSEYVAFLIDGVEGFRFSTLNRMPSPTAAMGTPPVFSSLFVCAGSGVGPGAQGQADFMSAWLTEEGLP